MSAERQNIVEPLLLSVEDVARALNVSIRKIQSMNSAGMLPLPIHSFGRRVLWSRVELEQWVSAGCPNRQKWEILKKELICQR
jgi:excisionase family DNA binding protein